MRWNFLARRGRPPCGLAVAHLLVQQPQLFLQAVNLPLLADDGLVERFEQVFRKRQLGFEFVKAGFGHGCLVVC